MGAIVLNETVMTSVQILWVNLIMDTFAALALATESAKKHLLDRPPTARAESIVSDVMARNILGWSIYQIGVLCFLIFSGEKMFNLNYRPDDPFYWLPANNPDNDMDPLTCPKDLNGMCVVVGDASDKVPMYTMVFNLFVWLQIFNQFNARKIMNKEFNVFAGLLEDYAFLAITVVTILVQIFAVMFMGRPLRCTALNMDQQLFTIGLAFGILLWNPLMTVIFDPSCF